MSEALLVLNAGSSSVKFSLFAAQSVDLRPRGEIEGMGGEQANATGGPRISHEASRVSAWVIPTEEGRIIARHTMQALRAA